MVIFSKLLLESIYHHVYNKAYLVSVDDVHQSILSGQRLKDGVGEKK